MVADLAWLVLMDHVWGVGRWFEGDERTEVWGSGTMLEGNERTEVWGVRIWLHEAMNRLHRAGRLTAILFH